MGELCRKCGEPLNAKQIKHHKIYHSRQCANSDRAILGSRKPGRYKKVLKSEQPELQLHHICQQCGKDFTDPRPDAKYCGQICMGLARRKPVKLCKVCGINPVKRHTRDCCSKECLGIAQRTRPRPPCLICGGPTPHWDSRTCSMNCQAEFKRRSHLLRIQKALGEGVQLNPFYNLDACKWFADYDKDNNTVGKYATNGGEEPVKGYWLDYINHDKKLIIEWNEKQHYNKDGSLRKRDVRKRDDVLKAFPGYEFWSIKEETMQIDRVISTSQSQQYLQQLLLFPE